MPFKKGDKVRIKPEFLDPGEADEGYVCVEDEANDVVGITKESDAGMALRPWTRTATRMLMSTQHTPGPWQICRWNDGKSFTVWRELIPAGSEPRRIERMLNAAGNKKRFRSKEAAIAAIAKATGSAA